jgi:hypothetical protein
MPKIKIQALMPERLPGGHSSGRAPIWVDAEEVQRGILVELEHTPDPRVAYEIAVDHLFERPDYYTRLRQIEGLRGLMQPRLGIWAVVGALVGAWLASR